MIKIAHTSDIHIRKLKYHEEYRIVFSEFYKALKHERPDYIVVGGDLVHTKTDMSPEMVDLLSDFLGNLASITETIVIPGNHDGNLKNEKREDAITPVVKALNNPNIVYLKKSEQYSPQDGLTFNHLSIFDRDNWSKPQNAHNINIALYHGSISGCLLSNDWSLEHGEDEHTIFQDHDFAMLGDIHKRQFLDTERRVAYCGSLVQQGFGEGEYKGFLMWEIEDKDNFNPRFVKLYNPRPFITIRLNEDGTLPDRNVPKNTRLRIVSQNNLSSIEMASICSLAKAKWNCYNVTSLNRGGTTEHSGGVYKHIKENLRNIKTQEKHILEYLKESGVSEEVLKEVLTLNNKFNKEAEQDEEVMRNVVWELKEFEWDNLFNYGEKNKINFENLTGVVGLLGPNFSGKSSVVDSILFTLFNSTSKGERKNVHVINQKEQKATGKMKVQIGGDVYQISRNLQKYTKKSRGKETQEAKVELDFTRISDGECFNGTTRNETDANIRKRFGTFDDFLLTTMASQMDFLSFIKEGTTKRKEILAKFLDLEIFDKKFKLAKKEAAEMRGVLKRMQGKHIDLNIKKNEEILSEISEDLGKQDDMCERLSAALEQLDVEYREIDDNIKAAPTEHIDIAAVKKEIANNKSIVTSLRSKNVSLAEERAKNETRLKALEQILSATDIVDLNEKLNRYSEISEIEKEVKLKKEANIRKIKREGKQTSLLDGIPCEDKFPTCKFIHNANKAKTRIPLLESSIMVLEAELDNLKTQSRELYIDQVNALVAKYNDSKAENVELTRRNERIALSTESNNAKISSSLSKVELLDTKRKIYEENRETIENLNTLLRERRGIEFQLRKKKDNLKACQKKINELYIEQGTTKQTLVMLQEQKGEVDKVDREWKAYELFMQCMHPNGIPYKIIKQRLPHINEEISKVLSNLVEFEVYFESNGKNLDINLHHPNQDSRPLSMGSGAEKTIASMAIRLALIGVTNLPKSQLFILDEPATALDQEHMEGFTRLLRLIKEHFKTVILISHLDSLKDVVDVSIQIQKEDGYAKVIF